MGFPTIPTIWEPMATVPKLDFKIINLPKVKMFIGKLRVLRLLPTTSNFSIFELYGFCFPTHHPYVYTYIELRISKYKGGDNAKLYLAGSYLAFSALPTLPIATGLALAVLAEIASFVPIPPNIDIVVRLLLLQMVMSKNEIKVNICHLACW